MAVVSPDRIMCFDCVEIVDRCSFGGIDTVCCASCLKMAPVEKALDDCFVFIVAGAVEGRLRKDYARSYNFMPYDGDRAMSLKIKTMMIKEGSAVRAA